MISNDRREKFWRKHAPTGYEDAFAKMAEHYRNRQAFGSDTIDRITQEVTEEDKVDRACRMVLRMRRAAEGRIMRSIVDVATYNARFDRMLLAIRCRNSRDILTEDVSKYKRPRTFAEFLGE